MVSLCPGGRRNGKLDDGTQQGRPDTRTSMQLWFSLELTTLSQVDASCFDFLRQIYLFCVKMGKNGVNATPVSSLLQFYPYFIRVLLTIELTYFAFIWGGD